VGSFARGKKALNDLPQAGVRYGWSGWEGSPNGLKYGMIPIELYAFQIP